MKNLFSPRNICSCDQVKDLKIGRWGDYSGLSRQVQNAITHTLIKQILRDI
jgi:hypothetical protein